MLTTCGPPPVVLAGEGPDDAITGMSSTYTSSRVRFQENAVEQTLSTSVLISVESPNTVDGCNPETICTRRRPLARVFQVPSLSSGTCSRLITRRTSRVRDNP
jgi:hypothetical protein